MNTKPIHRICSLHDKITEKEEAFQKAVDENKDHHFLNSIKAAIDSLKKELKELEIAFHDEFKSRAI